MPGLKPKDHTGKRFGQCLAISYEGRQTFPSQSVALWKLKCDCGKVFTTAIRDFISTRHKDCGHVLTEARANSNRAYPIFSLEDKDLESIIWHLHPDGYAFMGGGNNKISAHRMVLERKLQRKLKKGEHADHANRDKNDDRRENLRIATKAQNAMNTGLRADNTSGYTGVYLYWPKQYRENGWAKRWTSRIYGRSKTVYLGYFKTPEEAARAYNEAAQTYYGEFAVLNDV